jgi:AcrR family transcriptional regulator
MGVVDILSSVCASRAPVCHAGGAAVGVSRSGQRLPKITSRLCARCGHPIVTRTGTMPPVGRQALIEAARLEFAEQGYAGASIRSIAQRAGVSLSALYHYYSGKQELLYAISNESMDAYLAVVDRELAAVGDDPAERLAAVVTATVRFRCQHPAKSSVMFSAQRHLERPAQEEYRRRLAELTRLFQRPIEDGVDQKLFRTPYPDDARRSVIAMCNAIADWYRPGGELTEDDLVERYVSLALTVVEYHPSAPRRPRPGA